MTEVIYYIADDGTKFEDEGECRRYEILCLLRENEKDFAVFRSDSTHFPYEKCNELADPEYVFYIKANTERAVEAIREWFDYFGVRCPFEDKWAEECMCDLWGYVKLNGYTEWTNINEEHNNLSIMLEKMG